MDEIAKRRREVWREMDNLMSIPRRLPEQEERLKELQAEIRKLMYCGDNKSS